MGNIHPTHADLNASPDEINSRLNPYHFISVYISSSRWGHTNVNLCAFMSSLLTNACSVELGRKSMDLFRNTTADEAAPFKDINFIIVY